jgi:hypothetical protein
MAERDEMMQLRCFRVEGVLLAVGLAAGLASTAAAQQQPTIAVLPAQYYSADASSAQAVTQALMARFKAQGYRVMPLQRVRAVTAAMRYRPNRHYTDGQVVGFGRRLGAPLVAYPRLLALGYPAAARGTSNSVPPGAAVLHLRVINTRTRRPVYFRQIASDLELVQKVMSGTGCQPSGHQMDHRQADPRLATRARLFVVLRKPTIFRQPAKRTLNDPAMRQQDKALSVVRAFDDLQDPSSEGGDPRHQLAGVVAVGPDQPQPGKSAPQLLKHPLGAVAVLDPRTMDHHDEDQPERIHREMTLAAFDLLAGVVAVRPPFWGVFTVWLSMIAAEGVGSRPSCWRTWVRRASCTASRTPPSRHLRKCSHTSPWGGKSCGRYSHWQPVRA